LTDLLKQSSTASPLTERPDGWFTPVRRVAIATVDLSNRHPHRGISVIVNVTINGWDSPNALRSDLAVLLRPYLAGHCPATDD
jgi:hypothetical protein